MASLFKCHYCNAITDTTDKDARYKENPCLSGGNEQKKNKLVTNNQTN